MKKRELIIVGMKYGATPFEQTIVNKHFEQSCNLEKIERLRRLIANGLYQVSSAQVAESLVRVMLG